MDLLEEIERGKEIARYTAAAEAYGNEVNRLVAELQAHPNDDAFIEWIEQHARIAWNYGLKLRQIAEGSQTT